MICRGYFCEECGGVDTEVMNELQEQLLKEGDPPNLSETNMSRLFWLDLYSLRAGMPVFVSFAYKDKTGETMPHAVSETLVWFKKGEERGHTATFAVISPYNSGGRTISVCSELVQKIFNPDKNPIRQVQQDMLEASKRL